MVSADNPNLTPRLGYATDDQAVQCVGALLRCARRLTIHVLADFNRGLIAISIRGTVPTRSTDHLVKGV